MKVSLSKYNNSNYDSGGSTTIKILWYLTNVLFFINPFFTFYKFKNWLLRLFGAKIGKGVIIKPSVNIKYPWLLEIGSNVWIGENVWIDNLAKVTIGNNCCISQGAMLLCGNHNYKKVIFDLIVKEIILEDGVWIGAKCIVCPGVNVNSHAILTVGSIATTDLDAYTIYQGNPAKKIRKRIINE